MGLIFGDISFIDAFNVFAMVMFTCCYTYQLIYIPVALIKPTPVRIAKRNHKYAVLVCARNERTVIADLIKSIRSQNYPQELIDIFVVADNCTDDTAAIAQESGAIVFERFNTEKVGKGYAMTYGFDRIRSEYAKEGYEAYFVFDADNILDVDYFKEMNATFDAGAKASTSYRNSKNYDSNWISAGYATWFLREAKFLSQARLVLNTSCSVSGTGYFIAADIIERHGGWKWHLLTEDIEFSVRSVLDGVRISYTPTAIFYDEQPVTFRDSWNQRFRWAKGFYQVFWGYGLGLVRGIVRNKRGARFACFDLLVTIAPGMLLSVVIIVVNCIVLVMSATGMMSVGVAVMSSFSSILFFFFNYFAVMTVLGVLTTIVEWSAIRATPARKLWGIVTFPFFMLTYIPIALVALVKKGEWKPIKHIFSMDVEEFRRDKGKKA